MYICIICIIWISSISIKYTTKIIYIDINTYNQIYTQIEIYIYIYIYIIYIHIHIYKYYVNK